MLFNSSVFMIFFPVVLAVYFILPKKVRYLWLLVSSYYFYMSWNPKYGILLFFTTGVTYLGGLAIDRCNKTIEEAERRVKTKKIVVALGVSINMVILAYFKYTNFLMDNISHVAKSFGIKLQIPEVDILLPVGISFFTFQAVSYLIDVYREEIYVEKNFFRYALFVSFFPQLVAGPIERSKNLLRQLAVPPSFSYENIRKGFWIMVYGYFLKIVLADRIAIYVDTAYGDYTTYSGFYLVVAALLLSVQIYCDFYGYSVIAMGAAKMMGYQLMDNFNAPFLAKNIDELWRRWHISLNTWFRDYLYIPLGGNKKGKVRQYLNKVIVFFVSGLWHGADWTFVIWGLLNGGYQMIGEALRPVRDRIVKMFGLKRETFSHKLFQIVFTYIAFSFSFIFFRASSLTEAAGIIQHMAKEVNPWIFVDGSLYTCGLDQKNFTVMIIGIIILIFTDYCKYKKIILHEKIMEQEAWFRILLAAGSVCLILLLGIWGTGYDQTAFIYFQF